MAIAFRDFVAPQTDVGSLLRGPDWATISAAVDQANQWIASVDVRIINVETVVLPGIFRPKEQGTEDTAVRASNPETFWHQFVRVWYELP